MLKTLSSLRVLEFSHAVLGPACGLVLADLGAEVIRIEPIDGDPTRKLKGFGTGYYPFFNRNKKSLAVDIKSEQGKEIIFKLLESTDVLVENFGPGTMDRLGFSYDALASLYPTLVYCSLKGFLPGPYSSRLALDEVVQFMSGIAYMTGPIGQPLRAGASIIDIMTGTYGAIAVLAALRERDATGKGQLVKSALFETAAFLMGHHMAYAAVTKEPVPPMPARVSAWAVYRTFNTCDNELVFIGVTSDKQWVRFCESFEMHDLLADERLATNNGRIDQREWLIPNLTERIAKYSKADVLKRCEIADLPFSPISKPEDLFTDEQLIQGHSLLDTVLPNGDVTQLPRLPLLLEDAGSELEINPPKIGEHSKEILSEIGIDQTTIEKLIQNHIVAA
ncbi:MAG: CoA transferase [Anaerolineae bacterium]|nr:CoA transferase [Anaerolineae bacterium]